MRCKGKAALVTMAFEPRFRLQAGRILRRGRLPYRRDFGEAVETSPAAVLITGWPAILLSTVSLTPTFGSMNANRYPSGFK